MGKVNKEGEERERKKENGDREREGEKKNKKKQTICFDTCWQKEKTTEDHNIKETAATTNICINHNKF